VKIEVAYNGGGTLEDDQYERVKRNICREKSTRREKGRGESGCNQVGRGKAGLNTLPAWRMGWSPHGVVDWMSMKIIINQKQ